jgi:hypothetical protein
MRAALLHTLLFGGAAVVMQYVLLMGVLRA